MIKRILFMVMFMVMIFEFGVVFAGARGSYMNYSSRESGGGRAPLPLPKGVEKLPPYKRYIIYAEKCLEEGDFTQAIKYLDKAKKIKDDDPLLYEMYGHAYDGARDEKKSFAAFKKAILMYMSASKKRWEKIYKILGFLNSLTYDKATEEEVRRIEAKINKLRR
jgi:predicted Zn-dependent protease